MMPGRNGFEGSPCIVNEQPPESVNSRKRKSKGTPAPTPEQAEIKFLTIELNAVRTHVLELETSNIDLKRKVNILKEVIKTYDERETSSPSNSTIHQQELKPPTPSPHSNPSCHTASKTPIPCPGSASTPPHTLSHGCVSLHAHVVPTALSQVQPASVILTKVLTPFPLPEWCLF